MEEYTRIRDILFSLCAEPGTPGDENMAAAAGKRLLEECCGEVLTDDFGCVIARLGHADAPHILLDAHIDEIGMVVTNIDDKGFLQAAPCGGVDARVLPDSLMLIYGRETLHGIVTCIPPHLMEGGGETVTAADKISIDVGLSKSEAQELIPIGSRIRPDYACRALLGTRVAGAAIDDRAGCAALIRCAELLRGKNVNVTVLLSTREETGGQGAGTAAYRCQPDECIAVDVSFASQPGVDKVNTGELSGGPMVGIAPSLDKKMRGILVDAAAKNNIPFQPEVIGGETGTNADNIGVSCSGVRCALLSIPERNMHTPAETVDLCDIENTARLIAVYIEEVSANG